MKRREFVRLLTAAGLTSLTPGPLLRAENAGNSDQLFISVNADGGWDPTHLFDPKENNKVCDMPLDPTLVNDWGMRWSAVPNDSMAAAQQYKQFFTSYGNRLTLIRGIDTLTTSHVLGMKAAWTGFFGPYPSIGALFGAVHGSALPLSYISFGGSYGGNDYTAGLDVTKARLSANGSLIERLAVPNIGLPEDTYNLITESHTKRLRRQLNHEKEASSTLILRTEKIEKLLNLRLTANHFTEFKTNLSKMKDDTSFNPGWFNDREHTLKSQAEISVAALATGLTSSVSLNKPGFDTHGNNRNQYQLCGDLLEGLHYLLECLKYYDLDKRTTILVGSDIGRGPFFNDSNGKDHFNAGARMVIHPEGSKYGGNSFGETTSEGRLQAINFETGQPEPKETGGKELNTRHVLLAMQHHLGIINTSQAADWPLKVEEIPALFPLRPNSPT